MTSITAAISNVFKEMPFQLGNKLANAAPANRNFFVDTFVIAPLSIVAFATLGACLLAGGAAYFAVSLVVIPAAILAFATVIIIASNALALAALALVGAVSMSIGSAQIGTALALGIPIGLTMIAVSIVSLVGQGIKHCFSNFRHNPEPQLEAPHYFEVVGGLALAAAIGVVVMAQFMRAVGQHI
ncbi:MAG: hypothetical protein Q8K75_11190 [Chlamydiales bacterium]|nr:hypothetical protein [Chlamydiales bacterium]